MKTRKRIVFLLLTAALVLGIAFVALRRPPLYAGQSLDYWLDKYAAAYYAMGYGPNVSAFQARMEEMQKIDRVVRGMGPSAVPGLLAEMQSKHRVQNSLHGFLSKRNSKYPWLTKLDNRCFIAAMRPQTAAHFLFDIGPEAAPAISALVAAAMDTNQVLRANALNALGSIHQQPELAVPVLIRALTNTWDANFAVYSLGKFGTNAAAAAPALRRLVADSSDNRFQMSALTALQKVAPDATLDLAMPVYLRVLKDKSSSDRYSVILSLLQLGPRAKEAVPVLTNLVFQDKQLGQEAAYALRAIDPPTAAEIWDKVPRGADIDEKIFDQQPPQEPQEAFETRVRAMGNQAVPYLIRLVKECPASGNEVPEFDKAAKALGDMGNTARPAIPALEHATDDSRWYVRVPARAALIKINGESLAPLINELKDTVDSISWYETAMLLAAFGTNAEPAIPVVIEAMKNHNDIVQGHGAILLGAIHRRPEVCLPVLVSLLDSPSVSSRQKTLGALSEFGDDARPALPEIKKAENDFDPWTRMLAKRLVKKLETNAPASAGSK